MRTGEEVTLVHHDLRTLLREVLVKHFATLACLMEKAMAPHSSTLAWKIPWTEEPSGLQSMGW